jgi:hypothetical protein
MNGPKNIAAVWRDDYTITMLGLVILIVGVIFLITRRVRRTVKP